MLVNDFTHGVKDVLERCISIVILKFQNMGLIYCKIINNELFTIEFWPIPFKNVGLLLGVFGKIWGAIKNWGKRSDMVDVSLPEIISWEI